MLNLDTHIVVHLLDGTLRADEVETLGEQPVGISSIVLWELAKLQQKGRIAFGPDDPKVEAFLRKCTVWPIDAEVAVVSTKLDITSDPADEMISATSIVHGAPLLTRDGKLRGSNLIPIAN